jgi:mannosyl-3-phosphoglycerate phosphatase family protein
MTQLLIFTDIDGTLIDFESYSYAETAATVAAVVQLGIPLILCSSKTRAEQEVLRQALAIPDPFIVENGSAIFWPANDERRTTNARWSIVVPPSSVIELGVPAAAVWAALTAVRQEIGLTFQGYSDLTVSEVAAITGLDEDAAARARQREYSETIVTSLASATLAQLEPALTAQRMTIVSGGKFHTVMGAGADKGKAVSRLIDLYRREYGDIVTIGLGDSANDAPLLAAVDHGYLLQKPGGVWQELDIEGVERVAAVGPAGWRLVVEGWLNKVT